MRSIFIFYVLLVFAFTACRKKPNENQSTPIPALGHSVTCPSSPPPITNPEMLACKFQPGTFWVFKDSVTSNIDTLFVQNLTKASGLDGNNPCPMEVFDLKMTFKNDTGNVLIPMKYVIQENGFILNSDFFWTVGGQPIPYVYTSGNGTTSYKAWDSLFIYDRYYKKVAESYAVQFTSIEYYNQPTRMYCQSMKSYFNTEFGFLQFDLRDRLTGKLTGRRKIIERNIVR